MYIVAMSLCQWWWRLLQLLNYMQPRLRLPHLSRRRHNPSQDFQLFLTLSLVHIFRVTSNRECFLRFQFTQPCHCCGTYIVRHSDTSTLSPVSCIPQGLTAVPRLPVLVTPPCTIMPHTSSLPVYKLRLLVFQWQLLFWRRVFIELCHRWLSQRCQLWHHLCLGFGGSYNTVTSDGIEVARTSKNIEMTGSSLL